MNPTLSLPRRSLQPRSAIIRLLLPMEQPWFALLFAAFFYLIITSTVGSPWRVTAHAYYTYLADAMLHGQLHLRALPQSTLDLSLFQGRYYLYWGPLPALIMMPFVAVFGLATSDVLQSIVLGAVNSALFALLLRKLDQTAFIPLSPTRRAALVLFFTLGTPHTTLPAVGRVWFTGQITAMTCILLAYLAAFSFTGKRAFFWTGCAVAALIMTRMSAVIVALFLVWYLLHREWPIGWRRLAGYCLLGVLPVLGAGLLLMIYNALRFGNPLDVGVTYHAMYEGYYATYQQYGLMSLHYLPMNFYFTYLFYPFIDLIREGRLLIHGGSLFLLSPLFFAAFYTLWQDRTRTAVWVLWITFLLGNIPILLLMGPTIQFGSRYSLDFLLPLLLLTVMGMRRWPGWLVGLLVVISAVHYIIGALMILHWAM